MAPQWTELYRATDFRNLDTLCDRLQASEVKGISGLIFVFPRPTRRGEEFLIFLLLRTSGARQTIVAFFLLIY